MPQAAINGTEIHYVVDGSDADGVPMLVLHGGLGLDHVLYRRTLGPLAEDRPVVFVDHRGNGRSGRPPSDTITMEQLADDAVGVADDLGMDRFVVLGHSYGGFIAQELALRHPDRLAGLILVSTTPGQLGTGEDPDRYAGPPPPEGLLEALMGLPSSDADFGRAIDRLLPFYMHRRDPADVSPLFDGTIFDAAAAIQGFMVLAGWSSVDRLATLRCPTLLVVGREDVMTYYRQSERIADRLANAEVAVLDECGHWPWLEEPDAFFASIQGWLEQQVDPT